MHDQQNRIKMDQDDSLNKTIIHPQFSIGSVLVYLYFFGSLTFLTHSQPSCRADPLPHKLPLLFGESTVIDLERYFIGPNITFEVQPNDNFSSIREQYSCNDYWEHKLGKIIDIKGYHYFVNTTNNNNVEQSTNSSSQEQRRQVLAMLGQSNAVEDIYMIYYNVPLEDEGDLNQNQQRGRFQSRANDDQSQVLEIPRGIVTKCTSLALRVMSDEFEAIIDCRSKAHPQKKILGFKTVSVSNFTPITEWEFIESEVFVPKDKFQYLPSTIKIMPFKDRSFLLRICETNLGYIELWRWTNPPTSATTPTSSTTNKQLLNLYDRYYFFNQGVTPTSNIQLIQFQILNHHLIVLLDHINGIHLMSVQQTGRLSYQYNIRLQYFTHMFYNQHEEILFLGKRGQIEQYDIGKLSRKNINDHELQVKRIKRYHLHGYEELKQIISTNRLLYVISSTYLHVIHLTNIQSNERSYEGSYMIYTELYCQHIHINPQKGTLIKLINYNENVRLSECQVHPPYLYLNAPLQQQHRFLIEAYSRIDGSERYCFGDLQTQLILQGEDKIYENGYQPQNDTLYANRPGRSILSLDKYGLGKNIQYDIVFVNRQIQFEYQFRKFNPIDVKMLSKQQQRLSMNFASEVNQTLTTYSVSDWLIVQYDKSGTKEYYKCEKFFETKVECRMIDYQSGGSSGAGRRQRHRAMEKIYDAGINREYLLEAIEYEKYGSVDTDGDGQVDGTNEVQFRMVLPPNTTASGKSPQNHRNLGASITMCTARFSFTDQNLNTSQNSIPNLISSVKIRNKQVYIHSKTLKVIRIYNMFQTSREGDCLMIGELNAETIPNVGYFAPNYFTFDKYAYDKDINNLEQQTTTKKTIPIKSSFSANPIQQYLQTVYITIFNELLILRLTLTSDKLLLIENLQHYTLPQVTSILNLEPIVSLPYMLIVDHSLHMINQFYLNHQLLAFYTRDYLRGGSDGGWVFDHKTKIRLVDGVTFAVMGLKKQIDNSTNGKWFNSVFKMDALVGSFKEYVTWQSGEVGAISNQSHQQYDALTSERVTFTDSTEDSNMNLFHFNTDSQQQQATFLNVKFVYEKQQLSSIGSVVTINPYLQISIPEKTTYEPKTQQFYLTLSTAGDFQRDIVSLSVSSDSGTLEKGSEYPYRTYQLDFTSTNDDEEQLLEKTFRIDDRGWFEGNVFSHRYVCDDCGSGSGDSNDTGHVQFKKKIQKVSQIDLGSLVQGMVPETFYYVEKEQQHNPPSTSEQIPGYFQILDGFLMTSIKPHKQSPWLPIDTTERLPYQLSSTVVLSTYQQQQQSINCIKAEHPKNDLFFISLCQDHIDFESDAKLQLKVHSSSTNSKGSFKSHVISEYEIVLKDIFKTVENHPSLMNQKFKDSDESSQKFSTTSTTSVKQIEIINGIIVIRYYDNVFIFSFHYRSNRLILLDTIDNVDLQERLCWVEVFERTLDTNQTNTNPTQDFGIICTMCQKGLYYLVISIDFNQEIPTYRLIIEQRINLNTELQLYKIQLPEHSFYLQSIIQQPSSQSSLSNEEINLYCIVSNFNSFIWNIQFTNNTLSIVKVLLYGIVHRYNDFSPLQVSILTDKKGSKRRDNGLQFQPEDNIPDTEMSILYTSSTSSGKIGQIKEFVAVYDKNDYTIIEDSGVRGYYMYGAEITINGEQQLQGNVSEQQLNADNIQSVVRQGSLQREQSYSKSYSEKNIDEGDFTIRGLFVLTKDKISIFQTRNYIEVKVSKMNKQEQKEKVRESLISKQTAENNRHETNLQPQRQQRQLQIQHPQQIQDEKNITEIYTQSIIVFVETPSQANSVTLKLKAFEPFELTGLEIFLIVFGALVLIIVLAVAGRFGWKKYKQKQKVVKLLEDNEQEEEEGESDDNAEERGDRGSQITTSDAHSFVNSGNSKDQKATRNESLKNGKDLLGRNQLERELLQDDDDVSGEMTEQEGESANSNSSIQ